MIAAISLLVVLSISILITRIAAIALSYTGLSRESARFQARSAFTGVGFTTSETEKVVNHPVRRRIILILMLLGNAGIVTAVGSLILTFVKGNEGFHFMMKIAILVTGLGIIWALSMSRRADALLSRIVEWMLRKYTRLDTTDYYSLLHLADNYRVTELSVRFGDWIADKTLIDLKLTEEGVLVLGITRKAGNYLGAPRGDVIVHPGDTLILYGPVDILEELDTRQSGKTGDDAHERSVHRQREAERRQREEDKKLAHESSETS